MTKSKIKTLGHWLETVTAFDVIELNKINFKTISDQKAHKVLAVAYLIMYLTCEHLIGCQKKKMVQSGVFEENPPETTWVPWYKVLSYTQTAKAGSHILNNISA